MISKTKVLLVTATSMLALGASAALASGPVIVDDVEIVYTPPAPMHNWAGGYGGLSFSSIGGETFENGAGPFEIDSDTGFGVFAGYNWQRGNLVYGGEVSYISFEAPYVGFPANFQNDSIEIRGRIGYALNNVLLYGFVGGARTNLSAPGISVNQSGATYGLGAQMMFGSSMFAGLEVARRDVSGTGGTTLDTTLDTVSLRVGFQF